MFTVARGTVAWRVSLVSPHEANMSHAGAALSFSDLLCEAGPGGSAVGGSAHRALHTRVLCSPSLICPVSLGQGSAGGASMVPNLGGQQDNM